MKTRTSNVLVIMFVALASAAARAEQRELSTLADVVRVRVVDQSLHVEWVAPVQPPMKPMTVKGPEASWRVRASRQVQDGIEVERPPARVPGEAAGYWHVGVSVGATPDALVITGRRGGRAANDTTLSFSQRAPAGAGRAGTVHLVVTDNVARKVAQARATNVVELRAADPRLVREFLVPLLCQLTGRDPLLPGASDVYAVFEELAPDERVAREVHALLSELGHPSFARREAASARLAALAPMSVCAAAQLDRAALMPEQRLRLESFLLDHAHRAIPDPRAARRDVAFLADCLEFAGDDRVRRAAKQELEQLTGRAIPLHRSPTEDEWSQAADVVRARLSVSQPTRRSPPGG